MPKLTKLEVADRQLRQAIRLYLSDGDEVSVYTLVHAAAQVLADLREASGTESPLRDIELADGDDPKKKFSNAIFAARNYFKHADRDPLDSLSFDTLFIDASLIDAVFLHKGIFGSWQPETLVAYTWIVMKHSFEAPIEGELSNELQALLRKYPFTTEGSWKRLMSNALDRLQQTGLNTVTDLTGHGPAR